MQTINNIRILILFITLLLLSGCEYDTIDPDFLPPLPPDEEISFSQDIQPIFTSNCLQCHDGGLDPDLRSGNAYQSLQDDNYINLPNPSDSKIYTILNKSSHQSRTNAKEKQMILQWITQGAKDN